MINRIPWTLLLFLVGLMIPALGSRFYTFVATDIVILALFGLSVNLLMGTTGLVSFGHAAYFAVGAYTCAYLMKILELPFWLGFIAAGGAAALIAIPFGYFCTRLTEVYFAMLTLAFAQIVWAICFKWNDVTGGEQGMANVPLPDLSWMSSIPWVGSLRPSDQFYLVVLCLVAICVAILRRIVHSPFGRILTTIRENPERTEFIGINVRLYKIAVFVVAGAFAGFAGALFGVFNRGVFPDFAHWTKSAEVLIMALLGGMGQFWGPVVGALVLSLLKQEITAITQYWSLILGLALGALLFVFPKGILGTLETFVPRRSTRSATAAKSARADA